MSESDCKRRKVVHISKKGLRALGIAESFKRDLLPNKSVLAGVIMRGDFFIDGFSFTLVSLGGIDATDRIIYMIKKLNRPDVSFILLNGTVIALYNVIDLHRLYVETGLPLIALSYEESEGIDKYLRDRPMGEKRIKIHKRNGPRLMVKLKNGLDVFIRPIGMSVETALYLLNKFTIHGRYPEPIRVAKNLSRAILFFMRSHSAEIVDCFSKVIRDNMG